MPAEVARVAAHLGLQRSEAELQAVAARCSFGAMKAGYIYGMYSCVYTRVATCLSCPLPYPVALPKAEAEARDAAEATAGGVIKQGHFREGKTGGWRELMSAEQAVAFDAKTAELASAVGGHQAFRTV